MNVSVSSKEESDMRKMKTPEIDVIRFTESDVIVASGGGILTLSQMGDGDNDNNIASFGGHDYTKVDGSGALVSALNSFYGGGIKDETMIQGDGVGMPIGFLFEQDGAPAFNGNYKYDSRWGVILKQ